MKIGLVLDDTLDVPDGVQQYVLTLGRWLSNQGHDVHYLVGQTSRTDLSNIHSLSRNVAVRFNGNRMRMPLPTNRRKLRQFLKEQHFDVLHIQMPYSPFMAARLIRVAPASVKIIGTFHIVAHGKIVAFANRLLGLWLRSSLNRFNTCLAVSPAAADFCRQMYGRECRVLPNVVDIARFQVASMPTAKPQIVFLGRLVPRKGCATLLKALSLLPNDVPEHDVIIGGSGPLETELKQTVDQLKLSNVRFIGFVDEVTKPALLANAAISVFPSQGGESFGIVLVEAMAAGHSVVLAGDNAGYRSVMTPYEQLLFDPFDAPALAQLIERQLRSTERIKLAHKLGEHAAQFDVRLIGPRIVACYR